MSAISNISNLKAMVESASAEERAEILALLQPAKKEKVAKAPAEPVLDPAYVVAEPATKGLHKGKPRWQNTDTENYVYEFPAAAPAPAKAKKAAKTTAPVAAPVADDEARDKRLIGRMTKEEVAALSKEDKKRRNELKKQASEERKASRSPEEQAKIDARVAAMQAGRAKSKAAAGGSPSAEGADDSAESGSAEE
jgi:hypothetical protein